MSFYGICAVRLGELIGTGGSDPFPYYLLVTHMEIQDLDIPQV